MQDRPDQPRQSLVGRNHDHPLAGAIAGYDGRRALSSMGTLRYFSQSDGGAPNVTSAIENKLQEIPELPSSRSVDNIERRGVEDHSVFQAAPEC
jgi:hypothetical protein